MKLFYSILLMVVFLGCRAQTHIYPIQGGQGISEAGAYYKDLKNVFDKFTGTWKYQNGNISLTITLQKKIMYYDSFGNDYTDMIIGEYKYVDQNGTTLINTLPNLSVTTLAPYENNIAGIWIRDRDLPISAQTVELNFRDPERRYLHVAVRLKYIPAQGGAPAKLELKWTGSMSVVPEETSPTEIRVPEQDYILEKQ